MAENEETRQPSNEGQTEEPSQQEGTQNDGNSNNQGSPESKGNVTTGSDEGTGKGENKVEVKTIKFRLSDKTLMWSTPSKSIELSAFTQKTGSQVTTDDDDWKYVKKALNLGILIRMKPDEEFPKFMSKDISYGRVEEREKARKAVNTEEYLNMLQDDVVAKVKEIEDPRVLIALLQAEKKGKNKEGVPRQIVMSSLRNRVKQISINGMYDVDIDDL